MSDSDETVGYRSPNNENDIENCEENSPSILSNWCDTERKVDDGRGETTVKSPEYNTPSKDSGNLLKIDVNDFSRTSGSPEFPLNLCGLKRKGQSNESGSPLNAGVHRKYFRREVELVDSDQERETENCSKSVSKTSNESQEDGMPKTETLLAKLETEITKLENKNSSGMDPSLNRNILENVKSQLAVVQRALVEANRRNQVERKKVTLAEIGSTEFPRQLSKEQRQALFTLAGKQRNVLAVFKTYKNLVQRLKIIKEQQENPSKENSTGIEATSMLDKISLQTRKCAVNAEDEFLRSNTQRPLLQHHGLGQTSLTDGETNVKTANATNPMDHAISTVNPTIELVPAINNGTVTISNSSGIKISQAATCPQNVTIPNRVSLDHGSKSPSTFVHIQPNEVTTNQSVNRQSIVTPLPLDTFQNVICTAQAPSQKIGRASPRRGTIVLTGIAPLTAQTNFASVIHPPNTTINASCAQSGVPATSKLTIPQGPQDERQSRELVRTSFSCPPVEQLYVPTVGKSQSNQSTSFSGQSMMKQTAGTSLETLVKKGVLTSGRNVLTARSEGKLYSASLSEKGTIISAGGEGFSSPRSWVKAILGSKRKVKNEVAWKMISYKGKTLLEYANATITEPPKEIAEFTLSSASKNANSDLTNNGQRNQRTNLITSQAALSALLRNCWVTPITKEELVPSDEISSKNFWETAKFELESINRNVLHELEF